MNRYIIQYHSKTRAALVKRDKQQMPPQPVWIFNYPNLQDCILTIALQDRVKKTDNVYLHTGLNIVADIRTDSEEKARETSKNHVETILNLVSFSAQTYCDSSVVESIISIANSEPHPFRCYVYPFEKQEILNSLTYIDEPIFGTIFNSYDASALKPRTLRALAWLRKGIGEENIVDQFVSYWVGLEVIKHALFSEKLDPNKEWEKVAKVFTSLGFKDFSRVKEDGRNGLLHGFKELNDDYIKEIKSYVEPIRKTLVHCIGKVLGLEDKILSEITNKPPRKIEKASWSVMKGKLRNMPGDFREIVSGYPVLDRKIVSKQYSIDKKGILSVHFQETHHFHCGSGIVFEWEGVEMWGKKDSGIKQITLHDVNIDKAKK